MVCHWKPMLLSSVFFGLTICIQSRPTDDGIDSIEIPNKSDSIQLLELSSLDPEKSERKKMFLKIMLHNLTNGGLNIPVEVIYDSFTEKYHTGTAEPSKTTAIPQQTLIRRAKQQIFPEGKMVDSNSRKLNSEDKTTPETPKKLSNGSNSLVGDAKSTIIPIVLRIFASGNENFANNNNFDETSLKSVQNQLFIMAILGQADELNSYKIRHERNDDNQNQATMFTTKRNSAPHLYSDTIPSSPLAPVYLSPYILDPRPLHHLPLDIYRQWPSPFAQYFPIVIRDPFQSVLNYFSDLVEYGPAADVCRQKSLVVTPHISTNHVARFMSAHKNRARYLSEKTTPLNHNERFYGNEQNYYARKKRSSYKKEINGKYYSNHEIKQKAFVGNTKTNEATGKRQATESSQPIRGSDVGPQITKLIVRRGGVAIAGAGGIATAGSGGTAIVGPGGTAFTTPASSGGVAMVGPGGKVVKVPDLTNVLYGRTNANIAATGAGHATFTTKDGEVFTTSDQTGGMAMVTPEGSVIGVSDNENLDQIPKVRKMTKELQLPVGARLLTTGPIIYYNPIYPTNSVA